MSSAVGSAPPAHSTSDSLSGRTQTIPAVPAVNGHAASLDHSRRPAPTVTPTGATGFTPNGGAIGASQNKPQVQFGSLGAPDGPALEAASPPPPPAASHQASAGLNVNQLAGGPRTGGAAPAPSPSPIPQPANPSGGRPPSSFQGQGNGVVFGQQPPDQTDPSALARPLSQVQLGDSHIRRNSSQSVHSDVGNHGLPTGPQGRNYGQAGRGRGGYQGYHHHHHHHQHHHQQQQQQQQHHHQQQPPPPQQQPQAQQFAPSYNARGGGPGGAKAGAPYTQSPARGQQFQYQGSPHLQNRTPLMNTTPGGTPYMQPGQMLPIAGHNGVPYFQTAPDPSIQQHYNTQIGFFPPVTQYAGYPPSPRSGYQQSAYGAPPMQPTFSNQPQPQSMSRQSSQVSVPDRPASSTLDQAHAHTPSLPAQALHGTARSPALVAAAAKSNFAPPKKTTITIKNAAGEVVDFKKQAPAAQAPAAQPASTATTAAAAAAPATTAASTTTAAGVAAAAAAATATLAAGAAAAVAASTSSVPTPPSRTGSAAPEAAADASQTAKTDEEKRRAMQEAVKARIAQDSKQDKQDKAEDKADVKADDKAKTEKPAEAVESAISSPTAEDDKEAAATPVVKVDASPAVAEEKKVEEKAEEKKVEKAEDKVEDKEEEKQEETAKPADAAPAKAAAETTDEDDEFERIAAEMAAAEEEEARREEEYAKKKAAEKEARLKKEREEAEEYERNMKKAEAEAEAAELAREKEREAGVSGADDEEKRRLFAELTGKKAAGTPASSDTPAAGQTPAQSGTATPVSDVSMGPPLLRTAGGGGGAGAAAAASKRAKVAELTLDTKKPVEPPEPSATLRALQSARKLSDISSVKYPAEIASPNPALNQNAPAHRAFKYDKAFLLQFQNIFKEKPTLDWDTRIRDALGDGDAARAGGASARTPMNRTASNKIPPPGQGFAMGTFGRPPLPPGTTSEQRFAASNAAMRSGGAIPGPFAQFNRQQMAPPMGRSPSSTALGGLPGSPRVGGGGSRGGSRAESKRSKGQNNKGGQEDNKSMPLTAGMQITALHTSETGWKPHSTTGGHPSALGPVPGGGDGHLDPAMVQRKVKAALNKMTPNTFDKISDQILDIAAQSKSETDGRTLRQVIQLTFEKATDEAHWAPMYANFCRKMLETMSPEVKDENIKDKNGQVVAGGNLFRKYLLNRCQEEFERGWKVNLPARKPGETEEAAMLSDEYYQAAAAKRRGLGLVRFIGELFKLGMLTERIMHECVKKLVDYEGTPEEAEVESLTSLLRTIGKQLEYPEPKAQQRMDTNIAQQRMDVYFQRINNTIERPDLPSRLKFMLMDIVDLRKKHWVSKDDNKGPKTIAEIRAEEEEKARQAELQRLASQSRGGRGGGGPPLGRGDARSFSTGYGQVPPPDNSNRVNTDDLRRLGNRNARNAGAGTAGAGHPGSLGPTLGPRTNSGRRGLGPSSLLSRGGDDSGASSRTGTPPAGREKEKKDEYSTNAFSALAALENEGPASPPSNPASPPTQKSQPNIDRARSRSPGRAAE